jgi:3'(2'), 5'-bisphosphate nucleotidase
MEFSKYLYQTLDLAQLASQQIMEIRASGVEVQKKPDGSPVTNADLRSHKILQLGLEKMSRGFVVSEEGDPEQLSSFDISQSDFWLVDPLDGTRDFIKGESTFAICIAHLVERVPVMAVLAIPAMGQIFFAERGRGSYLADMNLAMSSDMPVRAKDVFEDTSVVSAARVEVPGGKMPGANVLSAKESAAEVRRPLNLTENQGESQPQAGLFSKYISNVQRIQHPEQNRARIAGGGRAETSARLQKVYDLLEVKSVEKLGSALKFGYLARGDFDIYPRLGMTYEWDTAAGQLIAEEAGCQVLDIETLEPIKYGKRAWENDGGFIALRGDLSDISELATLRAMRRQHIAAHLKINPSEKS